MVRKFLRWHFQIWVKFIQVHLKITKIWLQGRLQGLKRVKIRTNNHNMIGQINSHPIFIKWLHLIQMFQRSRWKEIKMVIQVHKILREAIFMEMTMANHLHQEAAREEL